MLQQNITFKLSSEMKDESVSIASATFGSNLRMLRKGRHLTQEKLAEELGVCTKHISELETGKTFISGALMDEIARYFDTSFDELFLTEERRMERDGEAARIASSMLRHNSEDFDRRYGITLHLADDAGSRQR